jgi:hypothetical protein
MKSKIGFLTFALSSCLAGAQGTFVVDQQSTNLVDGAIFLSQQPAGQSFTPAFSSIGFVEIHIFDRSLTDTGPGATIAINLYSGSITGTLLGTTDPIDVPAESFGTYDFFFANSIGLTPGAKYFFQPVQSSGADFGTEITFFQYPGGNAIQSGIARTDRDLWFREGIVRNVPEPSSADFLIVAGGALFLCRKMSVRLSKQSNQTSEVKGS